MKAYNDLMIIDGLQYCKWDEAYLKQLYTSGINAVHITLVYHERARETISLLGHWNRLFEQYSDWIVPVYSMSDVTAAKKSGKVGIFFGAQNCSPIDDEIDLISVMRRLGLLIMQLTYNNQSLLACGCYESEDSGITNFGAQAIAEMNRVGMIIDMSHSGERSTLEAIELSNRPICISHANPYFAAKALRNKSDTVIKALAESGGLMGFSLYPFHLPNKTACTLENFCNMVADTADLIGIDHLGIGTDLCAGQPQSVLDWMRNGKWSKERNYGEGSQSNAGWPSPLPWFKSPCDFSNIHDGLIKKGFHHNEVAKIMGQNWFDFLEKGLEVN